MPLPSKPLQSLTAADIMSQCLVMVPRDMSLRGAARVLARAHVTGGPVVDANGRCIGVLSATDFMHWVEKNASSDLAEIPQEVLCKAWQIPEHALPRCTVEDVMTKDPVLVSAGTKIGELARVMMNAHIHRVIVVDRAGKRPVGIVSSMDILAAVARAEPAPKEEPEPAMAGVAD